MNRSMQTLLILTLIVGAAFATGTMASADGESEPTEQYRAAMWYFVPEVGDWAAELERAVTTVELKPEVAVELAELAHRGEYLVYDLEGTPAPAAMADAHEQLLFAVRQMTEAAQIAAQDPTSARLLLDNETDRLRGARREIRGWLISGLSIPVTEPAAIAVTVGQ